MPVAHHGKHWPIERLIKSHISVFWPNLAKQIGKHVDNTSINKNPDRFSIIYVLILILLHLVRLCDKSATLNLYKALDALVR